MIKVALIVDEYFGAWKTAYGGYGFLARKLIARYVPNADIQLAVLLNRRGFRWFAKKKVIDGVNVYKLPRNHGFAKRWLARQRYDVYLSIELTSDLLELDDSATKLILWIQDPRPKYVWENIIQKMQIIHDPYFYNQKLYDLVHDRYRQGKVVFASQGTSLNPLAIDLYRLDPTVPIYDVPNPIEIDTSYRLEGKTNSVIFLGRLEPQKRAWLFCEIAKRMPDVQFYVLGQFFRDKERNQATLQPYMEGSIENLHFVGHDDGELKKRYLREAKLLVSTSIWEGIPISWLEALSYGTLIVSCFNREELPSRFGKYIGDVVGDGFDDVDRFVPAIRELLTDDAQYRQRAEEAMAYIRGRHTIAQFQQGMRKLITDTVAAGRTSSVAELR